MEFILRRRSGGNVWVELVRGCLRNELIGFGIGQDFKKNHNIGLERIMNSSGLRRILQKCNINKESEWELDQTLKQFQYSE